MGIEEVELEGLDYFIKFKERLEIVMAYINDGRDITDDDYSVLQELHRIQKEGRLPFYKVICTESAVTTTQPDLFCQSVSTTIGGMKVVNVKKNIKH
jgi:hypothetical protein